MATNTTQQVGIDRRLKIYFTTSTNSSCFNWFPGGESNTRHGDFQKTVPPN